MMAEALAPAKVNLTLHVTGRRDDGYHLLDSLVVFTDFGDSIEATGLEDGFTVDGPFADQVPATEDNLVLKARDLFGPLRPTSLRLTKNLPVAAGLGGGSSDAAAACRAIGQVWKLALPTPQEAASLGADVPVCLHGRPCRMQGIGEILLDIPPLPDFDVVLVNPGVSVPTPKIFASLASADNAPMERELPRWTNADEFLTWLGDQRNDLTEPAMKIAPKISNVLDALRATGALRTGMSGSGATCWALFQRDGLSAQSAADFISGANPGWWCKSGRVLTTAPS